MKIGVVSGKGGVGKTSLTASLASLASNDPDFKPIILDCDVDAPNLALILPKRKLNSNFSSQDTFTTMKAIFLEDKCIHCKKCYDEHFCEFNALKWDEKNEFPIIDYLACEGCGACKVLCPEHAFSIEKVKSGEIIYYDTIYNVPFAYGKTKLGSTTSGKLVTDLKEYIKSIEEFPDNNLILIDGPPGIGCPVIATLADLDYVITITEPTPSGLHDLIRVIELIQQFQIPLGIIVNKFDIESPFQEKFKVYIKETNFELLGKIPFDLSIPKAMAHAQPVVDFLPDSKASIAIKEIYQNLKSIILEN
jgi:MinD superfamily P-loop ATPase